FGRTADTNEPYNAHSYYDSLQLKLNRKFTNGFTLITSYAFGKAIDFNASTSGGNFNNIYFAANRGLADWDRRHVFTQSYVYELPFGQGTCWPVRDCSKSTSRFSADSGSARGRTWNSGPNRSTSPTRRTSTGPTPISATPLSAR